MSQSLYQLVSKSISQSLQSRWLLELPEAVSLELHTRDLVMAMDVIDEIADGYALVADPARSRWYSHSRSSRCDVV